MTERKKYVTKDERKEFMHWLILKYNILECQKNFTIPNSRELADKYEREKNIKISKVSIYRWVNDIKKYIDEEMTKELKDRVNPLLWIDSLPPESSKDSKDSKPHI